MSDRDIIIRMTSDEYGSEDFSYDSLEEAHKGFARLVSGVHHEDDGITRTLEILERLEMPKPWDTDPYAEITSGKLLEEEETQ